MIRGLARADAAQFRQLSARDRGRAAVGSLRGDRPFAGDQLRERFVPVRAERKSADALYDAGRGVYYAKPALRGWLHLLWFGASLVFGTLLLARAHGPTRITTLAIYAASVSGLFGISALYHRGNWTAGWSRRLQRLDHAMIFFLIAGTATPVFLLAARGAFGLVCLIVMWALTLTAAVVHLAWMRAPEVVVGATFVGLGGLPGAACGVDSCRCRAGSADTRRRRAVLGRRGLLPSSSARPLPVGVRLSRGLSRLRMRRRDVPVYRDSPVHQLSRVEWLGPAHAAISGFALPESRQCASNAARLS
jgi:hemolysin III